jgi:hypothetical protein
VRLGRPRTHHGFCRDGNFSYGLDGRSGDELTRDVETYRPSLGRQAGRISCGHHHLAVTGEWNVRRRAVSERRVGRAVPGPGRRTKRQVVGHANYVRDRVRSWVTRRHRILARHRLGRRRPERHILER